MPPEQPFKIEEDELESVSSLTSLSDMEDDHELRLATKDEDEITGLTESYTKSYSAKHLYDMMVDEDELIELDPEFQRDVVWSDEKQMAIIDSYIKNYHVPEVIFSVVRRPDGVDKRLCIDGKQRLTSIRRFFNGEIPHCDPDTKVKKWYKQPITGSSRKAKLLPLKYRKLMEGKQIRTVEYHNLSTLQEIEMFQRVQMGMALSTAEKWKAIKSKRGDFLHKLFHKYILDGPGNKVGLGTHLNLLMDRAAGYGTLIRMVFLVEQMDDPKKTRPLPSPQVITKYLQASNQATALTLTNGFEKHIEDILTTFTTLATDKQFTYVWRPLTAAKKPRLSPVEFALIGVLLSEFKKYAIGKLATMIIRLRTKLHDLHSGQLQMNTRVFATYDQFLAEEGEDPELGQKRKTRAENDDPEEEYRHSPPGGRKRARQSSKPSSSASSKPLAFGAPSGALAR